jgi:hypothetical protein
MMDEFYLFFIARKILEFVAYKHYFFFSKYSLITSESASERTQI